MTPPVTTKAQARAHVRDYFQRAALSTKEFAQTGDERKRFDSVVERQTAIDFGSLWGLSAKELARLESEANPA